MNCISVAPKLWRAGPDKFYPVGMIIVPESGRAVMLVAVYGGAAFVLFEAQFWRMNMTKSMGKLHSKLVFSRRVRVLADALSQLLPRNAAVLDVGCGDGAIDERILEQRPDVSIVGTDVLIRPSTKIPVREFDGKVLPFSNKSVDVVCFVDVLHHTAQPEVLLLEAARVSRGLIILKDHTREGVLAEQTLRLMDWVGNAHHGVALPYNYWSRGQWNSAFERLHLEVRSWRSNLGLYPFPASLLFERRLHFVAALGVS